MPQTMTEDEIRQSAYDRLLREKQRLQADLRKAELSIGRSHDVPRMNSLRQKIKRVDVRLNALRPEGISRV